MDVTDSGIVMLAKEMHFRKAEFPMDVTDSGIGMLAKEMQSWKGHGPPMAVTDSGIATLTTLVVVL